MNTQNWWTAWGQGIVAVLALLLGIYNLVTRLREHGWKKADREEERQRREWCERMRAALTFNPSLLQVVEGKYLAWARWGERSGYFVTSIYPGERIELRLPRR